MKKKIRRLFNATFSPSKLSCLGWQNNGRDVDLFCVHLKAIKLNTFLFCAEATTWTSLYFSYLYNEVLLFFSALVSFTGITRIDVNCWCWRHLGCEVSEWVRHYPPSLPCEEWKSSTIHFPAMGSWCGLSISPPMQEDSRLLSFASFKVNFEIICLSSHEILEVFVGKRRYWLIK